MPSQEFLLMVFWLVDDESRAPDLPPLRSPGPWSALADSEVIATEIDGVFWVLAEDRVIYRHFRSYHSAEFPAPAGVDRSDPAPVRHPCP
jgi:hypothetical protein